MIEGGGLSGKSWETTPDGRMGFDEYFVRKSHPVYVVDQVWRGRSGSDVAVFNKVRAGTLLPGELPNMIRTSAEVAWTVFRFGPIVRRSVARQQFPVDHWSNFTSKAFRVFRS